MKLIVGLGNPGKEYEKTRHNAGYRCLDLLAGGVLFGKKHEHALLVKHDRLFLAKPQTFMNRSGPAVSELLQYYRIDLAEMLVVCDDFSLADDTLRLRLRGSSGGHNGLQSVIGSCGTVDFPRLRIGVGPLPAGEDPAHFVLKRMDDDEIKRSTALIKRSAECIIFAMANGIEKAMGEYNRRPV